MSLLLLSLFRVEHYMLLSIYHHIKNVAISSLGYSMILFTMVKEASSAVLYCCLRSRHKNSCRIDLILLHMLYSDPNCILLSCSLLFLQCYAFFLPQMAF